MDETALVPTVEKSASVHLVARSPLEMQNAQADLARWLKAKLSEVAGFTIIPEFPIDVFAIRCTRSHVKARQQVSNYSMGSAASSVPVEQPDYLAPMGEGEYRSPVQTMRGGSYKEEVDGKTVTRYFASPEGFQDVIFPLRAARPLVMSAAAKAMALKVFDQIGICPAKRKADPLIVGQILGPKVGYEQKTISFIIAWHLNLNEL